MTDFTECITAAADGTNEIGALDRPARGKKLMNGAGEPGKGWRNLPAHNFRAERKATAQPEIHSRDDWQGKDPDLWLYRKKTSALLRRYMQWSLEAGRLPSLLGRELFRAKISSHRATTFEDRVIFLHDVERCLNRLESFDRQLIARVVLQEYDHEAAARMLQCARKTIERRLPKVIDELSDSLLKCELLQRLPEVEQDETVGRK